MLLSVNAARDHNVTRDEEQRQPQHESPVHSCEPPRELVHVRRKNVFGPVVVKVLHRAEVVRGGETGDNDEHVRLCDKGLTFSEPHVYYMT